MKGFTIGLFLLGLVSAIPNVSYAAGAERLICSANRTGAVNCKTGGRLPLEVLKKEAAKKCVQSFGRPKLNMIKLLKNIEFSVCSMRKCGVLKAKCNLK